MKMNNNIEILNSNRCLELYNAALNNFKEIVQLLDNNLGEQLSLLDKQQSDLLHIIENDKGNNVYTYYDLIVDLKHVRRSRRDIKNMLELASLLKNPIQNMLSSHENIEVRYNQISDVIIEPVYKIRNEFVYDKYSEYVNDNLQLKSDVRDKVSSKK